MKRPHFDVMLHQEELSRPQKLQDQIRVDTKKTAADRMFKENGMNKQPLSDARRLIEWIIVVAIIIFAFVNWIF